MQRKALGALLGLPTETVEYLAVRLAVSVVRARPSLRFAPGSQAEGASAPGNTSGTALPP